MGIEADIICDALMDRESSDFGGTFQYGKISGPCSMGTTGFGGRLVAGGISPLAEVKITIRKAVLPEAPEYKQLMSVTDANGTKQCLKVAKEAIHDCIYAWEVILNDVNQNA